MTRPFPVSLPRKAGTAIAVAMIAVSTLAGPSLADSGSRIAVIPIADHTLPTLRASGVTAGRIEGMLNDRGHLAVVDSGSVAASVRRLREQTGRDEVDWQEVAQDLDLDFAALLSVLDAHVDYLGEQFDHLAVGENVDEPGTRHLYEAKATLRLTVVRVEDGTTLLDEEVKAQKTEGYRQSHDAAKYAEVVRAVRDLAAIFDSSISAEGPATLTEDFAPLALSALEKSTDKLSDPLKQTFPLRGVVILVDGRDLTVDIGADGGLRKGMKFLVMRPGEVVTHPTTGKPVSTGDVTVGKARVSSVSSGTAVLKADRKAGAAAEPGYFIVEDG